MHRYFVDFGIAMRSKDGSIKKYLVEVKPFKETIPPTGKRKTKQLIEALATYSVNQSKWDAAREWAKKNGMEFEIFTEKNMKFL